MILQLLIPGSGLFDSLTQKANLYILLLSLLIILTTSFCIRRLYFSPLSHIPGPPITALTRYYVTLLQQFNNRCPTVHQWHKRYGPVVRVSPTEVSVLSAQGVKDIYADPSYSKYTPLYSIFDNFGEKNAFTCGPKEEHGWRRKAVSDRYTMSYVLKEEERSGNILRVVLDYLGFIQESAPKATDSPEERALGHCEVDLYTANTLFATDVVASHLFGSKLSTNCLGGNQGNREMINDLYRGQEKTQVHLFVEFPTLMVFLWKLVSWYDGLGRAIRNKLYGKSERVETYIGGSRIHDYGWHAYQELKRNGQCEESVGGKLGALVKDDSKIREQTWSDKGAASELLDHLVAGMDTTSDTLTFLMYRISLPRSKRVQQKLQAELFESFPPTKESPCSFQGLSSENYKPLSADILSKIMLLPYLDAVAKEALRLYTSIIVTLPRVVPSSNDASLNPRHKPQDLVSSSDDGRYIEGHFLPAGTVVGSFAYGIHRDEDIFTVPYQLGQDSPPPGVNEFYPERWLVGGGRDVSTFSEDYRKLEEERIKAMERRFWAFGSGGRVCVGRHLAILEIKTLLTIVYSRYNTQADVNNNKITLPHNQWNERRFFRDILPFAGANGILTFIPNTKSNGSTAEIE